jgi:hypothetical protein
MNLRTFGGYVRSGFVALLLVLAYWMVGFTTLDNVLTWLGVEELPQAVRDAAGAQAVLTVCALAVGAHLQRLARK